MKRTPLKRSKIRLRRTKLRLVGVSSTSEIKRRIQALLREIGIKRDGGCVLRHYPEANTCGGLTKDGKLILQAEHLITRSNSSTFGDMRNIVILCKYHHLFFKHQFGDIYWTLIKKHIGEARWQWMNLAKEDGKPYKVDWKLVELDLKNQLEIK